MKAKEICFEILRKMYQETEPKTLDNPIEYFKEYDNFDEFYLSEDRQEEIIKEVCNNHNLTPLELRSIMIEIHLALPSPAFKLKGDIK